jgi:autotransporter-associated beta strand protein
MAEYKFGCPQCGQHILCTEAYIGTQINCPNCQKAIMVSRPRGAAPPAASPPAPVERRSTASVLRIAVIAAIACGLCAGLVIGGFDYYSNQMAKKKELQLAQKAKKTTVKKAVTPKKVVNARTQATTNTIMENALTLVNGSTLQVRLDVNSTSAPVSLWLQSPGLDTTNLDAGSLANVAGHTVSLTKTLLCLGKATVNVTGNGDDTLALGAIVGTTRGHNPYTNITINALAGGPNVSIASFQSGQWSEWLTLQGGGKVTIAGNLTNLSKGSSIVYVTDGTTATLQGVSALYTTNGSPVGGANAYRYDVADGTLVLDNSGALTNNTSGTGIKQSWFILGAATSAFTGTNFSPPAGVLVATNNRLNAAVYLGDADHATGGLTVNAGTTNHVADGDAGFANSGVFTIGGQNTSGINTYANPIILGLTANVGKGVTLAAATGGEVDFTGGLLANGSDKTAGVTVGDVAHGGIVKFTAANTYGGNTFITNGTLALEGAGSIASSAGILLAAGATFDVSGLSSTFTLGTGQTLGNSASTAYINGNANTGSGIVSLTYNSGIPSLTVSNGTLNLAAATAFAVNNTGPALAPGSYKIIAKQTGGAITAATMLPTASVSGGGIATGATATLQIINGELYLVVTTR